MQLLKVIDKEHVLVKDNYNNKRLNRNITFEDTVHINTYNEELSKKRRLMYALMKREEEADARHKRETQHGFCPHCFMLIPMSGKCDCGYEVTR